MKNPRFWRDISIMLALAGFAALGISIAMDDAGEDSTLQIALLIAGVMVGPFAAVTAIFFIFSVRAFARLDRGENILGRWIIQPDIWRRFAELNRGLTAQLQPEWRTNPIEVPDTIDAPIEIVVTTEALRVGGAYFGTGKDGLRMARFVDSAPQAIELFYYYASAKSSPVRFGMRFPVAAEAEREGRAIVAWYAAPVPMGPVASFISAPARAANRNPRKARNIALIVAAIGAAISAFLLANTRSAWVKEAMNDEAGALAIMIPAIGGLFTALGGALLALIWHLRAKNTA